MMKSSRLITLLGPTAVGKTSLAARLASVIDGEVISADSRQVFRGMDIGTGKDLSDYVVDGIKVPSHLIDIEDAGAEYSVFNFARDYSLAANDIQSRGRTPVLCGGTGLYLDAVLRNYGLAEVLPDQDLHNELESKPDKELLEMLSSLKLLHNTTDSLDRSRMIRAIEIGINSKSGSGIILPVFVEKIVFGLRFSRETIRRRITQRLLFRLEHGMIEEVKSLLELLGPGRLKFYGLEYKYVTMYLLHELDYSSMVSLLNTAIHQFAKRQMTWFRRMERNGVEILWLEGEEGQERNLVKILAYLARN
jgi:tRNA dimethylallyltransferase